MKRYFKQLATAESANIYKKVIADVEKRLLKMAMAHTGGNQSRTARLLGISRGTLRKKLKQCGLLAKKTH